MQAALQGARQAADHSMITRNITDTRERKR
jgi:hypothetical protein